MTETKDKFIRVDGDTHKLADKAAKKLDKLSDGKIYTNTFVGIAIKEYIRNHPELGMKV